jgi:uncharacterized protein (TIGR02246 family)
MMLRKWNCIREGDMDEPSKLPGLEAMPPEDQKAIGATLSALLGGFSKRDAAMLEAVYSDDADWVNAFGTVRTGRAEIVAYLRRLFADANFDAGKLVAPPESRLRRLVDTAVAVSTHLRVTGQGLVSEIYMDARQDRTYAGGSPPSRDTPRIAVLANVVPMCFRPAELRA